MDWEEVAHLEDIEGQRILTSLVGSDYFIVANDDWHFYMFDIIGYRMLDKGFVKNYPINCMMQISDNMLVFGHQKGVFTLWETSKRLLTVDEIEDMRLKIVKSEYENIDWEMMRRHNISPEKMVNSMNSFKNINKILENAKNNKDLDNHADKIGKRRLKFRDSSEAISDSHI